MIINRFKTVCWVFRKDMPFCNNKTVKKYLTLIKLCSYIKFWRNKVNLKKVNLGEKIAL